ncbi:hypothetical protein DFJ63DRAFT_334882 [Scheffersomyces coipomensis]|uniref:uncharacterized protein n=1 Tax=Scheffersomyces coipomensis TaxID=1788519 RepID=UPI00315D688B
MIEGPIFSTNSLLAQNAAEFPVQDPTRTNNDPLPDKLNEISNIILLVDTTINDNKENVIFPDIPTKGDILHHNLVGVNYEQSSQYLFDNAHKFSDSSNPLTVTLQFKLGLEDNGTSMTDLLLKSNHLNQLGCFKFKIYIFKIVPHQKPDPFKMPPLHYFKNLKCIGFRFDTDIIMNTDIELYHIFEKERDYFYKTVNHHIPITIEWLTEDLEELHLGLKIRLPKKDAINLRFPKLTTLENLLKEFLECMSSNGIKTVEMPLASYDQSILRWRPPDFPDDPVDFEFEYDFEESKRCAKEYSIQNPLKVNNDPLPDKFNEISDIVLLVDTTINDNKENLIFPDIPTEGDILYHNAEGVNYEQSSQYLFDNVHKFSNSSKPLTVTLQFKLGLEDDGTSMDDLLLKANFLNQLGCFKFKIYIFKIVPYQKDDPFKMPPLRYFKNLNCIGFRFDTDIIVNSIDCSDITEKEEEIYYYKNANHHIPIMIGWLSEDLEELHLGHKVRLPQKKFTDLRFPKLSSLGVECYDAITKHNFNFFILNHKDVIKKLMLRDVDFWMFSELKLLEEVTFVGYSIMFSWNIRRLTSIKNIYWYGIFNIFGSFEGNLDCSNVFHFSIFPQPIMNKTEEAVCLEAIASNGTRSIQIPFRSHHAWVLGWSPLNLPSTPVDFQFRYDF